MTNIYDTIKTWWPYAEALKFKFWARPKGIVLVTLWEQHAWLASQVVQNTQAQGIFYHK